MGAYIIRRLLLLIPTLFLVTFIVFFSVRFIPGTTIDLMMDQMGESAAGSGTKVTREIIMSQLGLDKPVHIQYTNWLLDALQGDLGKSLWRGTPILTEIIGRLPVTLELGILSLMIALLISLPIGIYSAVRQDTATDYLGRSIGILCISLPTFWTGTMIMVYPSIWWGWSPAIGYIPFLENPLGNLQQFVIPAFLMGMFMSGTTMRMTRTMMLEVLRQDYIRTAWSKGLKEGTIIMRHALKNALIPVTTIVGISVAYLISGSVIMETIFSLPGVGFLMINALNNRDYPVLSGINLIVASFVLIVNLGVDLIYGYLDPRISFR